MRRDRGAGFRLKITAKRRLGIGKEHGRVELAVIVDQERAIVGDKLSRQAAQKEDRENPRAPVTASVAPEVCQPTLVEPGQGRAADARVGGVVTALTAAS